MPGLVGRIIAKIYARRGEAHLRNGNAEEAIRAYSKVIELDPANLWGYSGRANGYLLAEDHDRAIADYSVVIQGSPLATNVYMSRGTMYYHKGDYDQALADYTKSIENDPTEPIRYVVRAGLYEKLGQNDRAIADYTRSVQINPGDFRYYRSRADAYDRVGDHARAAADYEAVLKLASPSGGAFAYEVRAWALLKLGQLDDALSSIQKVFAFGPNNPTALEVRGHIFEALGRQGEAAGDFRQALASNPHMSKSADALRRLTGEP
jgi:tetratricopeptide (TPR) repeat protein